MAYSSGSSFPHYPPCFSGPCMTPECCAGGYRYEWPELVGVEFSVAKKTIEKDNPRVTAMPLRPGWYTMLDFCCNRVWVYLDKHDNVRKAPIVG